MTIGDGRIPCATPGCSNRPQAETVARLDGLCMPCFNKTGRQDPGVRTTGVVPEQIFEKAGKGCSPATIEQALTFINRIRKQPSPITVYDLSVARNEAMAFWQGVTDCPSGFHKHQFGEIWATIHDWYEQASSLQNQH